MKNLKILRKYLRLKFINFTLNIFFILFFNLNSAFSDKLNSIDELFKKANQNYRQGKYSEAIQLYEMIVNKGIKNGYLFYNLGNAYFKNKEIGKAILYYERARLLLPNNSDVKFNLEFANSLIVDKFPEQEISPFVKILLFFYNLFNLETLFIIVYLLFIFIILYLIFKWFLPDFIIYKILKNIISYILPLFAILFFIFILKFYNIRNSKYGIILSPETYIRSGPGEDYTVIFTLHEGTKLKIHNSSGTYYQVTLPNGYSGWLKKSDIGLIKF